jgi:hypothetical protein
MAPCIKTDWISLRAPLRNQVERFIRSGWRTSSIRATTAWSNLKVIVLLGVFISFPRL